MATRTSKTRCGVTLVELMIVVLIVGFLMIAVGATMASSQDAWNQMYRRSYSGPVMDGVILAKEFDRAVRKATTVQCDIDGNPLNTTGTQSVQVYYYKDPSNLAVTSCDGYSKFYYVANEKRLKVDEGNLAAGTFTPTGAPTTRTIAENVTSCVFRVPGASVEMVLRLDASQNTDVKDGNIQMTVMCSAVRHN
jgi:Tfp pilus assembly protein FimT